MYKHGRKCNDCKFYVSGCCVKNPPQVVTEGAGGGVQTHYPRVKGFDACSFWVREGSILSG